MSKKIKYQKKVQADFINHAFHELRTPIFVIKGFVDILDKWSTKDPDLLTEGISPIKKEVYGMKELTEPVGKK